jgi:adenylate cyclase
MTSDFTGKRHGMLWLWWRSKATLAINVSVTGLALVIYWTTFVGERPTPIFDFIHRTELAGLDARFQIRGPAPPDDRIVIVDIDQHSQEILGRWPFPRSHFATLVDVLREAGARVVAFDISFSQPDDSVRPIRQMQARLEERRKQGRGVDAGVLEEFTRLEEELNYDRKFAEAIGRFGKVVLGNFFLYTEADLQGLDRQALDRYAERAAYYPFPQVRATRSAQGPQSYARLIQIYKDRELLPRGAEANLEVLTSALPADTSATGFFNVFADPDGVVRRGQLALPYGRSSDYSEWDMYASIDVQAVRFFLNLMEREVVLNYGRVGIESIEFGPRKIVPDDLGRVLINYRGPARTYAYYSFADVVKGRFPRGAFRGKIVLVGASATGIADLRASPFGAVNFPGVEIHANVMDNILNQKFLQRGVPQVLADQVFIFLFGIPLGVWLGSVRPRWMALGLLLLVPFAGLVYFAFTRGWWLNAVTPAALTLLPNVGLVAIYRLLVEERERRKTRGAFQQFLSPEVVRRLLQNPELVGPRRTEITVLFSDIRDFTSISERLEAKEVAALLNDYITSMTEVIFHHQGTLDKYIGDMIMAFWGDPYE